jgi:hypothetical protein
MVERYSTRTRTRASKSSIPTAQAVPSLAAQCAQELDQILTRLDIISCTVAVAASALEGQNADVDRDVANTLRMCVRSSLADQVERLSAVIRKLQ